MVFIMCFVNIAAIMGSRKPSTSSERTPIVSRIICLVKALNLKLSFHKVSIGYTFRCKYNMFRLFSLPQRRLFLSKISIETSLQY